MQKKREEPLLHTSPQDACAARQKCREGSRVPLHETVDAVFARSHFGGNEVPGHAREDGPQRGQVTYHHMADEVVQGGYLTANWAND